MKRWKLWQAPTTVQYLLLKLRTHFVLTNVYKNMVSTHLFFTFLLITQDLSKIKKIPNFLLKTLLSIKRAQNFSKKYQTSWKLELVKVFSFFRQKPGFLEIIDLCLNFSKQDVNITMCKEQICVVCKHDWIWYLCSVM